MEQSHASPLLHDPKYVLLWGVILLFLFLFYLGTIEQKKKKIIGTLLTLVMSFFCIWAFNGQNLFQGKSISLPLGIDLAGGSSFTVKLSPATDKDGKSVPIRKEDVQHAIDILERRLSPNGEKDLQMSPQGDDRINILMPGVKPEEVDEVRTKIQQVAHLEFRLVHEKTPGDFAIGYTELPYREKSDLDTDKTKSKSKEKQKEKDKPQRTILVSANADMDGTNVSRAFAYQDPSKGWAISLEFNNKGADEFDKLAERGYQKQLAIVVDGEVISAPTLQTRHFGGRAEISGDFTADEARSLATALQNPLKNPMVILSENTISPAFGKSTIKQGVYTGIWGSLIVAVFMVVYYRFAGLIALVGLFVDFLLMFGAMSLFGFTLTMPGIAGMVLTIGMAVDANVLIYERMREEMKGGKSLVTALEAGFSKAFPAIFDAHVTALITSGILFYLASGLVKGFAVTMLVGIVGTLFGALIVTRVVFHWFTDSGKLTSLKVTHLIPDRTYNMLSYARPFIIGSFALAAISLGVFAVKGKNSVGIDFRGGSNTQFVLKDGQDLTDDEISKGLAGLTYEAVDGNATKQMPLGQYVILHSQQPTGGKLLSVRAEYEAGGTIMSTLEKKFPERISGGQTERVGSIVGSELAWRSGIAYIIAMVAIFCYLAFRYELAFAVGAIVALFHDCIIVVGLAVAFGQELSIVHIGAVLTVAGYSINDTIIVFDRIREMIRTKTGNLRDIMNEAISITLSRTLLTSLTAFMPMVALFFFGGPAMREFSLPILIGIIVGTYSSIYIASPLVLWWSGGKDLRRQVLDSHAAAEALKKVTPAGA